MQTRREFNRRIACVISSALAVPQFVPRVYGADDDTTENRLVTIFLRGGNDGLNTLAPCADPLYRKLRPTLHFKPEVGLHVERDMYFHPAFRELADIWNDGRLCIQQGVGYPNHSRSHFVSQAVWASAKLTASVPTFDGWLGRELDPIQARSQEPLACCVGTSETPEPLRGRHLRTATLPNLSPRQAKALSDLLQEKEGVDRASKESMVAQACRPAAASLRAASDGASDLKGFPNIPFGEKMRKVAQVIDLMPEVKAIHLEQEGYDTHSAQGAQHTSLLRDLSRGLGALDTHFSERGLRSNTLVMVYSEFGRRVQENASAGTDHGAAGPVFFLGGGSKAGMFGQNPDLATLDQGDVAVTRDFRDLYAAITPWLLGRARHLELPAS